MQPFWLRVEHRAMTSNLQQILQRIKDNADVIAIVLPILGGVLLSLRKIAQWLWRRSIEFVNRRTLTFNLGHSQYTRDDIRRATAWYVCPDCQDVDPSGTESWRLTYAVRQNAFQALDTLFRSPQEHRFTLLLADSGMGKTSLLLNYFARHYKSLRRRRRFALALVPLAQKDVHGAITSIPDPSETVLLLDAFDEDTAAAADHRTRLTELLAWSEKFRHVLITCRTQFFLKDEEIPRETGLLKLGATAGGESKEYCFYKIYLSPFSDNQTKEYLRRRFPWWRYGKRKRALGIAARINDLAVRPMLLAHIEELLQREHLPESVHELYAAMVDAWLERERPFVKDTQGLKRFCESLAVDIFAHRTARQGERITPQQLSSFVQNFGAERFPFSDSQLRGRSLLNRDAEGNLKFAHRSILEYLVVAAFFENPKLVSPKGWTDQMLFFAWEKAASDMRYTGRFPKNIGLLNLADAPSRGITTLFSPRSVPKVVQKEEELLTPGTQNLLFNYLDWPYAYKTIDRSAAFGDLRIGFRAGKPTPAGEEVAQSTKFRSLVYDRTTGLMWFLVDKNRWQDHLEMPLKVGGRLHALFPKDMDSIVRAVFSVRLPTVEEALTVAPYFYRTKSSRVQNVRTKMAVYTCDRNVQGSWASLDFADRSWNHVLRVKNNSTLDKKELLLFVSDFPGHIVHSEGTMPIDNLELDLEFQDEDSEFKQ